MTFKHTQDHLELLFSLGTSRRGDCTSFINGKKLTTAADLVRSGYADRATDPDDQLEAGYYFGITVLGRSMIDKAAAAATKAMDDGEAT